MMRDICVQVSSNNRSVILMSDELCSHITSHEWKIKHEE